MDKHKHIQSKIKTVNAEVKIFIEGSMFWKKMHTMQKRMTWEETAYCHPQKPQATGRVTSSYSSSNWLLLKTGKGIPKSRKETPCISPTALSSIAYWYGGNWIFPLPPRATNWNCSANLCPRKEAKTSNLLRNQPQQWTPKHLDSHRRESKGTQQLLKPSCQTNSMNWEGGCSCLSQHSCCALTSPCRKQTAPGTRGPDELGCPDDSWVLLVLRAATVPCREQPGRGASLGRAHPCQAARAWVTLAAGTAPREQGTPAEEQDYLSQPKPVPAQPEPCQGSLPASAVMERARLSQGAAARTGSAPAHLF